MLVLKQPQRMIAIIVIGLLKSSFQLYSGEYLVISY
jgi:hypothetical protein